jgi:hypothetical protein
MFRSMRGVVFIAAVFVGTTGMLTDAAFATCGTRGGPGYRGPDGKCVGWAEDAVRKRISDL